MDWVIIILVVGAAIVLFASRFGTTAVAVPIEHRPPIPEGGLERIEYFWRPG